MSKTVRIADYLAEQVERLADQERRSLANMVQILLEQALAMTEGEGPISARLDEAEIGRSTLQRSPSVSAMVHDAPYAEGEGNKGDGPKSGVATGADHTHFKPDFKPMKKGRR